MIYPSPGKWTNVRWRGTIFKGVSSSNPFFRGIFVSFQEEVIPTIDALTLPVPRWNDDIMTSAQVPKDSLEPPQPVLDTDVVSETLQVCWRGWMKAAGEGQIDNFQSFFFTRRSLYYPFKGGNQLIPIYVFNNRVFPYYNFNALFGLVISWPLFTAHS